MSQNDFTIANQGFPAFRADLNGALQALASLSEGATEPSTTFAYQLWYDSTTDILKIRNADNDAWINLFNFDQDADTVSVEGTDLVDDTTPQLGGDLDTNGNNIAFGDSAGATDDRAVFGAGSDMSIYHDGSNSYIVDSGTGNLKIAASQIDLLGGADGAETMATFADDGAVSLYYDNAVKIATDTSGVSVTGRAKGTVTTDNDSAFDLNASNLFSCTPSSALGLSFTNETAGVSGMIYLDNSAAVTVTAGADVHISAADLTAISAAGVYIVTFFCPDGTNVYLSASAALVEGS
jgi:hypothetical protein